MLQKTLTASALLAALLTVSACGTSSTDRGLSGAGLGAAAGTAIGALTGTSLLTGALVGGAIGGVGGAISDPGKINLGKPAWR